MAPGAAGTAGKRCFTYLATRTQDEACEARFWPPLMKALGGRKVVNLKASGSDRYSCEEKSTTRGESLCPKCHKLPSRNDLHRIAELSRIRDGGFES